MKLSIVLATRNEEKNIGECLATVKKIADEIIVYDESSTDNTASVARSFGASVVTVAHEDNFHITKQKAIDAAKSEWILQLDADERVPKALAEEIKQVISMSSGEIKKRRPDDLNKERLFKRHMAVIEKRDGVIGKATGEIVAFFIPRLNYFVGAPIKHSGVYPDPAIRLIKRGKARLPARSVHEIMEIDGEIAWLYEDMHHHDSPTISRYIVRLNRYTDLQCVEMKSSDTNKDALRLLWFTCIKPVSVFFKLYFRHKGYEDGLRGFLWAAFSSMHFPLAYYKYWTYSRV